MCNRFPGFTTPQLTRKTQNDSLKSPNPTQPCIPGPETVVAEAMEAFGEDGVLPLDLARGARQRLLVLADLLLEYLVHVGRHLDLAQTLHLIKRRRTV